MSSVGTLQGPMLCSITKQFFLGWNWGLLLGLLAWKNSWNVYYTISSDHLCTSKRPFSYCGLSGYIWYISLFPSPSSYISFLTCLFFPQTYHLLISSLILFVGLEHLLFIILGHVLLLRSLCFKLHSWYLAWMSNQLLYSYSTPSPVLECLRQLFCYLPLDTFSFVLVLPPCLRQCLISLFSCIVSHLTLIPGYSFLYVVWDCLGQNCMKVDTLLKCRQDPTPNHPPLKHQSFSLANSWITE